MLFDVQPIDAIRQSCDFGRAVGVSGELTEILVGFAGKSDSGLDTNFREIDDLETKFTRVDLGHKRDRDKTE